MKISSDLCIKWLLVFAFLYFLLHIGFAVADQPIIINQPDGGQTVCVVSGSVVTCF